MYNNNTMISLAEKDPFISAVQESLGSPFPDYNAAERLELLLSELPEPDVNALFIGTVGLLEATDPDGLPNEYNLGATGPGALKALAVQEGFNFTEVGEHLKDVSDRLKGVLSVVGVRLFNERAREELVLPFTQFSPDDFFGSQPLYSTPIDRVKDLRSSLDDIGLSEEVKAAIAEQLEDHLAKLESRDLKFEASEARARAREEDRRKAGEQARQDQEEDDEEKNRLQQFSETIHTAMAENPDKTMQWLVDNLPDSMDPQEKEAALLSPSVSYLLATLNRDGVDSRFYETSKQRCLARLSRYIQEIKDQPLRYWDNPELLGVVLPDESALQSFTEENPDVLNQPAFFEGWHDSVRKQRLKEVQKDLPKAELKELLQSHNLEELSISVERLGVRYEDADTLLHDVYSYFVANRPDAIGSEDMSSLSERLGNAKTAVLISTFFSRPNHQILQEDVEAPFKDFVEGLCDKPEGKYLFKSPEAQSGGTPYKYESTTFGAHAIIVRTHRDGDGNNTFYLDILGGGYSSDLDGSRLDTFAAFNGRVVEYPEDPAILVRIKPTLPEGLDYGHNGGAVCSDEELYKQRISQLQGKVDEMFTEKDGRTYTRYDDRLPTTPIADAASVLGHVIGREVCITAYDSAKRRKVEVDPKANGIQYIVDVAADGTTKLLVFLEERGQYSVEPKATDPVSAIDRETVERLRVFNSI